MTDKKVVTVIDAVMGQGKTTKIIEEMKARTAADADCKYLYITPYVDEVDRICAACEGFEQPEVDGWNDTKSESLYQLLTDGRNIASTHALFRRMDEEMAELIRVQGYRLVVDEVLEVVEEQNVNPNEVRAMLESDVIRKAGNVFGDGVNVIMTEQGAQDGFEDKYKRLRDMAGTGRLVIIDDAVLMWLLPPNLLDIFEEVTVLTYNFEGSQMRSYLDIFQIPYDLTTIDRETRETTPYSFDKAHAAAGGYAPLIKVVDAPKLNQIGDYRTALSSTWYKQGTKAKAERLRNNLNTFFRWHCKGDPADLNMWTTFKDHMPRLKGKGYSSGFLACNIRAVNTFRHKKNLAYCINRFMRPFEVKFFNYCGTDVDQEKYALAEMLQWIFRSRIRTGEEVFVYVPSRRMRDMLLEWIEMTTEEQSRAA